MRPPTQSRTLAQTLAELDEERREARTTSPAAPAMRPKMLISWFGEAPRPITRDEAARLIRRNRRAPARLGVTVTRERCETYISSEFWKAGFCIHRSPT